MLARAASHRDCLGVADAGTNPASRRGQLRGRDPGGQSPRDAPPPPTPAGEAAPTPRERGYKRRGHLVSRTRAAPALRGDAARIHRRRREQPHTRRGEPSRLAAPGDVRETTPTAARAESGNAPRKPGYQAALGGQVERLTGAAVRSQRRGLTV